MLQTIVRVIFENFDPENDQKLIVQNKGNALRMRSCNTTTDKHTKKEFMTIIDIKDYRFSNYNGTIAEYIKEFDKKSACCTLNFQTETITIELYPTDFIAFVHSKLAINFDDPFFKFSNFPSIYPTKGEFATQPIKS